MTPSNLKRLYEECNEPALFFSRTNMKYHGDTMANYGVRSATVTTNWDAQGMWKEGAGEKVEAWELYRRKPVQGRYLSVYFRKDNFRKMSGVVE